MGRIFDASVAAAAAMLLSAPTVTVGSVSLQRSQGGGGVNRESHEDACFRERMKQQPRHEMPPGCETTSPDVKQLPDTHKMPPQREMPPRHEITPRTRTKRTKASGILNSHA